MGNPIQETSRTGESTDTEFISGRITQFMKAGIKTTKKMGTANLCSMMEKYSKVNGKTVKEMGREF